MNQGVADDGGDIVHCILVDGRDSRFIDCTQKSPFLLKDVAHCSYW